jgi:hypothetical protein
MMVLFPLPKVNATLPFLLQNSEVLFYLPVCSGRNCLLAKLRMRSRGAVLISTHRAASKPSYKIADNMMAYVYVAVLQQQPQKMCDEEKDRLVLFFQLSSVHRQIVTIFTLKESTMTDQ